MSVEGSIAGLLRSFLCRESRDERQVRVLVERLWDLSRTEAQASFWRAFERGEDDVHHLHEWEELLGLVGSRQRFGELQEFLDNAQQTVAPDRDPSDSDQGDREMEEETDAAALLDQDQETIPEGEDFYSDSDEWEADMQAARRGPGHQQIAIWCAQAIESAERRQDVEQQSAVLRRRQDGTIEAPGGRSTHERAREAAAAQEWQQVVRRMNELVRSGRSVSTPAVGGPASSCWPGSSLDRNAQRGEVQKLQAEAADLAALDAAKREQAEAADVWL